MKLNYLPAAHVRKEADHRRNAASTISSQHETLSLAHLVPMEAANTIPEAPMEAANTIPEASKEAANTIPETLLEAVSTILPYPPQK